jgi:hypothetical protein
MPTIMSLMMLPIDVQIEIASHLVVTSDRPVDDLHSLWSSCSSMHRICIDPAIGRHLSLVWFKCRTTWDGPIDYEALLAILT